MRLQLRTLFLGCSIATALISSPVWSQASAGSAAAKQHTVEDFFRHPQYAGVRLSPNGQFLAAIVPFNNRRNLAVVDLKVRSATIVTSMDDRDVNDFWWASNRRIVFNVVDLQRPLGEQLGAGLFAVDRDGKNGRELSPVSPLTDTAAAYVFRYSAFLASITENSDTETDDILVRSNERTARYSDVYRMDTRTGRKTLLTFDSPGNVVFWTLDRNLVPRAAVVDEDNGELSVHYRESEKAPWRRLARFHTFKDTAEQFGPVAFDYEGNLIVAATPGTDKSALYKYDLVNNRLGERLVGHKDYDVGGGLIFDSAKRALAGVAINAERPQVVWFDPQWAAWQKMIDQALPDMFNLLTQPQNSALVLVQSFSDKQPGVWYLFDPERRNLERVVASRPWIDPANLAERKFVRYPARDGLEIPAYLTLPVGRPAKDLPLIVDVHGGPNVRGHSWGFSPEAQFLASRGYAVLQPDFRGSTGYGWKHYQSGWKQWGQTMQDDLNDGVEHLVKQGVVDRSRVCIYGGSYGGYAVMMGLVRDPDLWRCGVNFVGVTDMFLFEAATWSDYGSDWRGSTQAFFDYTVGNRKTERERFEKISPALHANKIRRPVFMAYGGLDRRVPIEHGERMRSALRSNNVPHEYVVYDTEGHGFMLEKNRFDVYSRVEKFLAEQLK